ncbi:MAG: histidine phosphatase family protein [Vulcanimicrobiaceae bacterium]
MRPSERTIVHLIRHGDALPDGDTAPADRYDELGLSTKGRRQAEALAARLARTLDLAALVTSPTRRARETADVVAAACGVAVRNDARLCELDLAEAPDGALDARERAIAIRGRLADLAEIGLREGSWASIAGAEPARDVAARIAGAVAEMAAAHPGAHVALVSHAGAINAYVAEILGTASSFFFPTGNTSLSTVRICGRERRLIRLNDTAHLETDAATRRPAAATNRTIA